MRKTSFSIALIFGLLAGLPTANAQTDINEARVPGGIAIIELPESIDTRPVATYLGNPVLVTQASGKWRAVIGLGLKTKPGIHSLTLKGQANEPIHFSVSHKDYPTQHIDGIKKSKVNLSDKDYQRHLREKKLINKAKTSWRDISMESLGLMLPVESRISGLFGRRRVLNQQPRNPHSGLDLAAPRGTPVLAPAAGKVVLTGDFFFLGKTVFIEHGQGLISLYAHLNKIEVKNGESVVRGQQFAEVGSSGRASGPHLHWGVYLNRVAVDPLLFIDKDIAEKLIAGKTVKPRSRSVSSSYSLMPIRSRS